MVPAMLGMVKPTMQRHVSLVFFMNQLWKRSQPLYQRKRGPKAVIYPMRRKLMIPMTPMGILSSCALSAYPAAISIIGMILDFHSHPQRNSPRTQKH